MNDIELTKIRHNQPTYKGFPIWVVKVDDKWTGLTIDIQVFFTQDGATKFMDSVDKLERVPTMELRHVTDVRNVSYDT